MRLVTAGLIGAFLPLTLHAPEPTAPAREAQRVARLQRHFDGALEVLGSRDVTALTSDQKANRARLVRVLSAYRDAGAYPRNYDFREAPTPYFVDRKTGILCAVANLMASTGRRDLVDRVAAADNNVWVADLAGNNQFRAWLDEQGLTLAEAARIQAPYVMIEESSEGLPASGAVVLSAAASASLALLNLTLNGNGERRWATRAGYATSALAIGVGLFALSDRESSARSLGAISLAVGTGGFLSSSRASSRFRSRATLSPIIPIGSQQGAGLSLQLTF